MSSNHQRDLYENEWSGVQLATELGDTGWKTTVPAPDFAKFTAYLRQNHVTGTALDLGCGGGRYTIALAQCGFQTSGIDFAESAIHQAIHNAQASLPGKTIDFRVGNVLELPYPDASFDVVNDDGCLHHIEPHDWTRYQKNVTRVLKPGGLMRIKAFSAASSYRGEDSTVFTHFFTRNQLTELLGEGFNLVDIFENEHPKTPAKRFWFAVFKKRPHLGT